VYVYTLLASATTSRVIIKSLQSRQDVRSIAIQHIESSVSSSGELLHVQPPQQRPRRSQLAPLVRSRRSPPAPPAAASCCCGRGRRPDSQPLILASTLELAGTSEFTMYLTPQDKMTTRWRFNLLHHQSADDRQHCRALPSSPQHSTKRLVR
jgi:hypothetical protein